MILGIGTDILHVERIEAIYNKFPKLLPQKILSPQELFIYAGFDSSRQQIKYLAKRFAAKEAVVKALGSGLSSIGMKNIAILNNDLGKPYVVTSPEIDFKKYFPISSFTESVNINISLADEQKYVLAFVVISFFSK
jgi:holo-[acyl-carrier protein] synthase